MSRKKNSDRKVTVPTVPTDQQLRERFETKCVRVSEHFEDLLQLLTQSVLKGILLGEMVDSLKVEFLGKDKLFHYAKDFHKALEQNTRIAQSTAYTFSWLNANRPAVMEKIKTNPLLTMKEALDIEEPVKPKRPRKPKPETTATQGRPAAPQPPAGEQTPQVSEPTASPPAAVSSPAEGIQTQGNGTVVDTHHAASGEDDLTELDAQLLNAVMDLFQVCHVVYFAPVKLPVGTVIRVGDAEIKLTAGQAVMIVPEGGAA